MTTLDWAILVLTQVLIIGYGLWKSRGCHDTRGYMLSDKSMPWFTIGLSIIATQASAVTFLSAPGQVYADGMRFLNFYMGLPIAMIVLAVVVVPIYHKLNVYTAYEYLEGRFDLRTRVLGAGLFLSQRGLAAGFAIYAPAIILSQVLGWPIETLCISIGLLVILYTVFGGSKGVGYTQKQQMFVILLGMGLAGYMVVHLMPEEVGLPEAVKMAGKMGKLNMVDFSFQWDDKYNIWTGLIGGFFLSLSYFGTDQSQVQRYLGGRSIAESRLGLLMNGIVKIPMQFLILFMGALLFVFYLFQPAPIFFNETARELAYQTEGGAELKRLEENFMAVEAQKREVAGLWAQELSKGHHGQEAWQEVQALQEVEHTLRLKAASIITQTSEPDLAAQALVKDRDYVFITFVTNSLPTGVIGLLIAVILSAAMASASSALNSLATTTVIDLYKRNIRPNQEDRHYLKASKWFTVAWGLFAIGFTQFAHRFDNLIQAVNVLGSLVYGVILGIFLVAFFLKTVQGKAVFYAAILSELLVLYCYFTDAVPFLWLNVIGCIPLMLLAYLFQHGGNILEAIAFWASKRPWLMPIMAVLAIASLNIFFSPLLRDYLWCMLYKIDFLPLGTASCSQPSF